MWLIHRNRNYSEKKLQENLDAEIFGVLVDEAKAAFAEEVVVILESQTWEDVEANCERIMQWAETWCKKRQEDVANAGNDTA